MKLVILYGPPAVGKLTVARELAKITGFKLFHNHLTQDLARELYPEFDETRFSLVDKIRITVIKNAAENTTDLLFTVVYSGSAKDDAFFTDAVGIVEGAGGQVHFAELTSSHDDILERADNPSRSQFHKLTDRYKLKEKLDKGSWQESVKYADVLKVDTSSNTPSESAMLTANQFGIGAK